MFDPLDLYDSSETKAFEENFQRINESNTPLSISDGPRETTLDEDETEEEDNDIPVTVLDLPSIKYSTPSIILTILKLLRSENQLNFKHKDSNASDILTTEEIAAFCNKRDINIELQNELVNWYEEKWPNSLLNNLSKIVNKIPNLKTTESKDKLLNYYTSIIRYCERKNDGSEIYEQILKEASLRISESCGRAALPSMHRDFQFNNLDKIIRLFEPSLTADNLGWKTWGSSMILSQIMVENDKNFEFDEIIGKNKTIRILELGSGTGLVGLTWAMKWKELQENSKYTKNNDIRAEIFLTDLPEIVDNLKQNVKENNLKEWVHSDVLDWTNPKSFVDKYGDSPFDVILVADPIYSPDHPQWVVNMITKFLKPNGICHLQIPIRDKYATERQVLVDLLKFNKLEVVEQKFEEGHDDWGLVKYFYRKIIRKTE